MANEEENKTANMESRLGRSGLDVPEALLVVVFGGVGGLLSWVYALAVGDPMKLTAWGAIPSSVALGVGAAFIGVYVIANADSRAFLRFLGFALLCGFSWKPVYDAGGALINQRTKEHQEQTALSLADRSTQLAKNLSATPSDQVPSKLSATVNTTLEALNAAQKVDSSAVQKEVFSKTDEVMNLIKGGITTTHPVLAAQALDTLSKKQASVLKIETRM